MRFLARLNQMKQRHERVLGVECALHAVAIGLGLCVVLMLVNRWLPVRPLWFAVSLPLALVWPITRWVQLRGSLFQTACDLDRRYQLQERLATAVELQARGGSENIAARQIADAQEHLEQIPAAQAYRVGWWRQGRFALLGVTMFGLVWFLPPSPDAGTPLTTAQRKMIQDQLIPLVNRAPGQQDFRSTLASAASTATLDTAQKVLGKLRGEATEAVEQQMSTLVEQIEALPIPDALKADLLKFAEQAGSLPQAQADARLADLKATLPEDVAAQMASELQALDASRRSLEALIAGVRDVQHKLAEQTMVALNQDGTASQEQGEMGNGAYQPLIPAEPSETLVLDNTTGTDGNAVLIQGTDVPDVRPQDFAQNDGVLVEQNGTAIAIPSERIPRRYQEPIEAYLRQIAMIEP